MGLLVRGQTGREGYPRSFRRADGEGRQRARRWRALAAHGQCRGLELPDGRAALSDQALERVHRRTTLAAGVPVARRSGRPWPGALVSWLQAAPLAIVLLCMFVAPLVFVVVVSFFDYDRLEIFPAFIFDNYVDIFTSEITVRLYLKTLEYAALVEAITVVIGFLVAYFLTFHVRTLHWRVGLLVACTIPFFTSNMIRMISWIPFLGREGILNSSVLATHLVKQPLDFLLFSDFAVIFAYVHILTMMMVAPIVNSMAKIDHGLIAAARDAGASETQIMRDIVIPMSKTGITL